MDKEEAIERLKQALTEIPHLKQLRHDDAEFTLWRDKVRDIVTGALHREDLRRFAPGSFKIRGMFSDDVYQSEYLEEHLPAYETGLKSIIQKYELPGTGAEPTTSPEQSPKAFVAHGGTSEALGKLCRFLTALGIAPLVIEEEPKEDRSVNQQVEHYLAQADCAVVLGTADDGELKDGKLYPRRNVHIEIGRFQERFPGRTVYLLEEGASLPSNVTEKLHIRFTQGAMDGAFIELARELVAFGMLRAVKSLVKEPS